MSQSMKTAEEIIAYLEAELAKATEMHKQTNGNNAQEALFYLIKLNTITDLLEGINGDHIDEIEETSPSAQPKHVEEKSAKYSTWKDNGLATNEEFINLVRKFGY